MLDWLELLELLEFGLELSRIARIGGWLGTELVIVAIEMKESIRLEAVWEFWWKEAIGGLVVWKNSIRIFWKVCIKFFLV